MTEFIEGITAAASQFATLDVVQSILFAAVYGIFVGAIPGLTATMAVALMVPLTYFMDDIPALAAIVTMEACAIFAGDIPTTLLRMPGTPASAAYADDAYGLTQRGRARQALGIALLFSVVGGLFGAVVLSLAAPSVSLVAGEFSSLENFWLTVLGLSCAVVVSRGSRIAGLFGLSIGLLIATVGLSAVHSVPRFTFGRDELISGISFIPAMIGLFGLSEVLRTLLRSGGELSTASVPEEADPDEPILEEATRQLSSRPGSVLRSGTVGSIVGMLPGAGADIGAWISYALSKRRSKDKEEYGHGSTEAVADATTANSSALAGAWMPALILGIPGDSVTAIVIGVLLMKNVTPGPEILDKQPELVYGIYLTFLVANIVLLFVGLAAIRTATKLVRIPRRVLLPAIVMFSILGSFAISASYFDVLVMLAMGLVGYALESWRIPLGPVVLGIILGGRLEESFVQNWTKADSPLYFFGFADGEPLRFWALLLGSLTCLIWIGPVLLRLRKPASPEPSP
ncbi:MAG: tripartite tricarboxylate transporter permease [Planctomycetota bacterium]